MTMLPKARAGSGLADALLRAFPRNVQAGLIPIGAPDAAAPLLLATNSRVALRRLQRVLRGRAAWILALDTGGLPSVDPAARARVSAVAVAAALTAAGASERVEHRRLVVACPCFPELATERVNDWELVRGPMNATDLPAFLDTQLLDRAVEATPRFRVRERLEIGVGAAVLSSALFALPALLFGWRVLLVVVLLIWAGFLATALGAPERPGHALRHWLPGLVVGLVIGLLLAGLGYYLTGGTPLASGAGLLAGLLLGSWYSFFFREVACA